MTNIVDFPTHASAKRVAELSNQLQKEIQNLLPEELEIVEGWIMGLIQTGTAMAILAVYKND